MKYFRDISKDSLNNKKWCALLNVCALKSSHNQNKKKKTKISTTNNYFTNVEQDRLQNADMANGIRMFSLFFGFV